jgi:hypothetical protein
MSGEVKRFILIIKTSANHSQALIGVASRLGQAYPSVSKTSSIFKRLGFYTLASNCVMLVGTTHLAMSTYTFNYCYTTGDNVEREL